MQKTMIGKPNQVDLSGLQKYTKFQVPMGNEVSKAQGSMEMIKKELDNIGDGVFIKHKRACRLSIR